MAQAELKEDFEKLEKDIIRLSADVAPKECKAFMRKEGNKLKNKIKVALKAGYRKKTGNLVNGKYLKRGKVYLYKPENSYETRIHFAPHAHLLELGFNHVKSGRHIAGRHLIGKTQDAFAGEYEKDVEGLVDDLTKGW
ncbi:hypothetical protein [Anaerotignum sp. MSJ-24]|uniref:hypothetical protein n=1 Tax=Anaerotignum sp. MSJ-24 TaxID=2841521 RepID=UPI001C121EC6|nr:hypothetical protein [Anaerotignum sp. MSJ-24]MBU5464967.1 hypothetical protein [Anaerotignum sp. MSJ-24]